MGKFVFLWEIVWVTLISFGEKNRGNCMFGEIILWEVVCFRQKVEVSAQRCSPCHFIRELRNDCQK